MMKQDILALDDKQFSELHESLTNYLKDLQQELSPLLKHLGELAAKETPRLKLVQRVVDPTKEDHNDRGVVGPVQIVPARTERTDVPYHHQLPQTRDVPPAAVFTVIDESASPLRRVVDVVEDRLDTLQQQLRIAPELRNEIQSLKAHCQTQEKTLDSLQGEARGLNFAAENARREQRALADRNATLEKHLQILRKDVGERRAAELLGEKS